MQYTKLDLYNTPIESLPDNLTVGGYLDLSNTKIKSLPDNLTVGGSLYLSNTPIESLPDNLTVGGDLNLSNTKIKSLPDNLTVGGYLNLRNTPIESLPDNLTVGGWLDLSNTPIESQSHTVNKLSNGDYVPGRYLYADGILTHIHHHHIFDKFTYYVGKISNKNVIYDGTNYAHCKDYKSGIAELNFKSAKDRGADQYKDLTLDSIVSKDYAITMYRIITGACLEGTNHFINSLKVVKDKYTINEIIELTKGQYGSEVFKSFFIKE